MGFDFLGLIVGALLGTLVMTLLMEGGQIVRLTRMSLPFILGTWITENRTWAKISGFAVHFVNGIVFSFGYGLLFEVLDRSDWWIGALAGALHSVFVLMVVLPVLPDIHVRMASEDEGPDPTPMLQPPGFLGLNYGFQTPVGVVIGHFVYGAILASIYRPLG
jgi:uncharacterized membrane protein YagU involved in acid resistance